MVIFRIVMRLFVRGIVQGVGFRPTVVILAREMGLNGYVINHGSNVEIVIDGDHEEFISRLKSSLPSLARIESVSVSEGKPEGIGFHIRNSTS